MSIVLNAMLEHLYFTNENVELKQFTIVDAEKLKHRMDELDGTLLVDKVYKRIKEIQHTSTLATQIIV